MKDRFAEWIASHKKKEEEPIPFKNFELEEEAPAPVEPERPQPPVENEVKNPSIELKVVRPESYTEVATVADYLLEGCTVFLNLELLDKAYISRMLDFLHGVTYAIDGQIKKSSAVTFIITPHNVDITDEKKI